MLTFDESGGRSLLAYLLCGGQAVVMETTVINTLTSTDWSEGFVGELNFGILGEAVVFTANVLNLLIIGGFHACRKREKKTDYLGDTGYLEVGTISSVVKLFLARNCRPGDVVFRID